jgi:CHASE3 domain sensor protein
LKQVTLHIADNKYQIFIELVRNLNFAKKIVEEPAKKEILDGIRQAVEEMNLIKAGKLKGRPAEQIIFEL